MSTEALWDMANETHPHSDIYAHQVDDSSHHSLTDTDSPSDDCADLCQNICHGHMSSITANNAEEFVVASKDFRASGSHLLANQPQAPPTPPPLA